MEYDFDTSCLFRQKNIPFSTARTKATRDTYRVATSPIVDHKSVEAYRAMSVDVTCILFTSSFVETMIRVAEVGDKVIRLCRRPSNC